MKANYQSRLGWFIYFLNQDLDHADLAQRMVLATELFFTVGLHLGFDPSAISVPSLLMNKFGQDENALKNLQSRLRADLEKILSRIEEVRTFDSENERSWIPQRKHAELVLFDEVPLSITLRPYIDLESTSAPSGEADPKHIIKWEEGALRRATLRIHTLCQDEEDQVVYHFLMCLDGVPLSTFKKCAECGAWFIHTGKRERKFCSGRCATKKANRERYERIKQKDPQRYRGELAKGRDRARQSYERQVRKELPGNNVKVGRRPRAKSKGNEED